MITARTKIAFLLGRVQNAGGISRVLSILSDDLVDTGIYDIHVISYHPAEKGQYNWNPSIHFHDLLKDRLNMQKGFLKASKSLRRVLKKDGIELLIICGHNVGPLAVASNFGLPAKLIYWPHSSFKGYKIRGKGLNERFTSAFSDAVVSLTKMDQKNYRTKTLARKVFQIYNPIDPKLKEREPAYNPNTKKIISVGRLNEEKNFHSYLIDVASIVLNKHKDYTWHIYGSGGFEEDIQLGIEKNNLQGRVVLKGHHDDIYSVYRDYSILVMTSEFEGFPMTLLEGMYNRIPLLSFDVPTGPNEIIRNEENGYLIKPFDVSGMADKLNLLIEDETRRMRFSDKNLDFISMFEIEAIIPQWNAVVMSLLTENYLPTANS